MKVEMERHHRALRALAARGTAADAQTLPGAQTYADNCQSCHGTTLGRRARPQPLFREHSLQPFG